LCPWHSPDLAERRAEWSRLGGRNSSNKQRAKKNLPTEPMTSIESHSYLTLAFKQTLVQKLDPGVLNALAGAARVMAELAKQSDVEARLADLERRLGGRAS
jgi:hypothetical protein